MSINRDCLGKAYGPVELVVDAERVAAFADAAGADSVDVAPPVFGIVPVWPAMEQMLADPELGVDVGRTVHGEQRMRFGRLIRAGDELTSTGRVTSIEDRGENEILVVTFETRDASGALVTEQDVVCVSRGTAAVPSQAAPERPRAATHDDDVREPDAVRKVELAPDITHRYAQASGDRNRIHLDDDFARSVGLPGIIVHGMCLFSIALQAVVDAAAGGDPERVRAASVRFRRPVQPASTFETLVYRNGAEARFEGRSGDGAVALAGTTELTARA